MKVEGTPMQELTKMFKDVGLLSTEEAIFIQECQAMDATRLLLQLLKEHQIFNMTELKLIRPSIESWARGNMRWSKKLELRQDVFDAIARYYKRKIQGTGARIKQTRQETAEWPAVCAEVK